MNKYFRNLILCGDTDYYCLICHESFHRILDVEKHIRWEMHRKSLKNQACVPKFKKDNIFKVDSEYYCQICNITLTSLSEVSRHLNEESHKHNKKNPTSDKDIENTKFRYDNSSALVIISDYGVLLEQWHCIVENKCQLCFVNVNNVKEHAKLPSHILKVIKSKVFHINENYYYRKIDRDDFYCFECKKRISNSMFESHWAGDPHCISTDETRSPEEAGSSTVAAGTSAEGAGSSTEAARTSAEEAGSSTEAPGRSTEVAGRSTEVARTSTEVAGSSTEGAGSSTEGPERSTEVAGTSTEGAGGSTEGAEGSTKVPGRTTEGPERITEVPGTSTEGAGGSTEGTEWPGRSTKVAGSSTEVAGSSKEVAGRSSEVAVSSTEDTGNHASKPVKSDDDKKKEFIKKLINSQKQYYEINLNSRVAECKECKLKVPIDFKTMVVHHKTHAQERNLESNSDTQDISNDDYDDEVVYAEVIDHGKRRAIMAKYGKENFIKLNSGGSRGYCDLCHASLSANIKVFKEHVRGVRHRNHLQLKGYKKLQPHSTPNVGSEPINEYLKHLYYSQSLKILSLNKALCVNVGSFILTSRASIDPCCNKSKCFVCDTMYPINEDEKHYTSPKHKELFFGARVMLLQNEFIREVRPNVYHCGFCNQIYPYWEQLERHLICLDHLYRKKLTIVAQQAVQQWYTDNIPMRTSGDPETLLQQSLELGIFE